MKKIRLAIIIGDLCDSIDFSPILVEDIHDEIPARRSR